MHSEFLKQHHEKLIQEQRKREDSASVDNSDFRKGLVTFFFQTKEPPAQPQGTGQERSEPEAGVVNEQLLTQQRLVPDVTGTGTPTDGPNFKLTCAPILDEISESTRSPSLRAQEKVETSLLMKRSQANQSWDCRWKFPQQAE